METGFAQLPLERYDELILENRRMMEELDNSVSLAEYNELKAKLDEVVIIRKRWDDKPALDINLDVLKEIIKEKFLQSEFAGNYILNELGSKEEIYGAFKYIEIDPAIDDEENQA